MCCEICVCVSKELNGCQSKWPIGNASVVTLQTCYFSKAKTDAMEGTLKLHNKVSHMNKKLDTQYGYYCTLSCREKL